MCDIFEQNLCDELKTELKRVRKSYDDLITELEWMHQKARAEYNSYGKRDQNAVIPDIVA